METTENENTAGVMELGGIAENAPLQSNNVAVTQNSLGIVEDNGGSPPVDPRVTKLENDVTVLVESVVGIINAFRRGNLFGGIGELGEIAGELPGLADDVAQLKGKVFGQ